MEQEWFNTARYAGKYIESSTLINNSGRDVESLNGRWNRIIDQYGVFYKNIINASWWELEMGDEGGDTGPCDYSSNEAPSIRVPSTINTELGECKYYEGNIVYTRCFTYEARLERERVFLYFHGAQYRSGVALNREWVGMHRGGSTPFCVEITDKIKRRNRLMVGVDCRRRPEQVPTQLTDWFNYGGLYRDVELIRVPESFIKDWFIRLVPGSAFSQIAVDVEVDNNTRDAPVRVSIPELDIDCAVPLDDGCMGHISIEAAPELWSPENPRLYRVRLTYGEDSVVDEIGFREIRVEGREILLNGESVWLRGICCHEESVENGKSLTRAEVEENMALAKELNCNFIRLAHYPHQQYTAKLADRAGMLLWEEIPVYWNIMFESEDTYADAENQLLELIKRDRNRASVIIWSVGNENQDTDERLAFMSRLVRAARKADGSRAVSAACVIQNGRLDDRLVDHLDVIGFNEYLGWYTAPETIESVKDLEADGVPRAPVIITETGAGALAGHHGPPDERWTEEFQERFYKKQIQYISTLKSVRGLSPWILYDFRSPCRQNVFQRGYNRKGLLSEDKRQRKLAFMVLQDFYKNR